MYDLVIKNGKLVGTEKIYEADIAIKDGKYAAFLEKGSNVEADKVIDANGNLVYPGIIDCHAHMNEVGFEHREDFETGSRAAVSGGITTLIDMPLNNDPALINAKIFDIKQAAISKHSYIDYGLWGGLVGDYDDSPESIKSNVNDLVDLQKKGVNSFKGFLCPNGDLFPAVNLGNIRKSLEILKPYDAVSGFHCEDYTLILERTKEAKKKAPNRNREEKISDFLEVHDVWAEYVAVQNVLALSKATGGRVHIVHISHPMVAELVKKAQQEGVNVTAETCPHYLGFTEDLVYELGAPAKCTPPLRTNEAKEKLWDYVIDGTLSCIGSDHSPAMDEEKDDSKLDIWQAWGGLNAIQYFFPMVFDMFVNKKGLSPTMISKVCGVNPAKIFGLYGRKGEFQIGFDGDIVIVDPEKEWKIEQEKLFTKGHVTCFNGVTGKGFPTHTIIRGKLVAKDGKYLEEAKGYGQFISNQRNKQGV
ncbi:MULTISPECIES: allantoinase AllB [Helcococcus]|uniref:allantoinase n=1 Tax=Helcococcus bovis TaxID=3153252 RepID=A0ABW9F4N1_9FIRM